MIPATVFLCDRSQHGFPRCVTGGSSSVGSAKLPPACQALKWSAMSAAILATLLFVFAPAFHAHAEDAPAGLEAIGGKWFVRSHDAAGGALEKPLYLHRDVVNDQVQYVDLFSSHRRDSNGDGIDDIQVSHEPGNETHPAGFLLIKSQGYPNHPTAIFPNSGNPNSISVQDFTFRLPLEPRLADTITRLPMGPIGTALNGVVFFNPFEQGGMNAVEGYSEVWLDACCGHPQQSGVYHYHKYPSCVKSPFKDDGKQHSPVIGFAWDGFPVHGPYEADGLMARDLDARPSAPAPALDVCNGHADPNRGYHYHATPGRFPYILGGYRGVIEPSNNRGLRRAGAGAIENNAAGESIDDPAIVALRPGSIAPGGKRQVTIELDPREGISPSGAGRRPGPMPEGAPSWVQIGPYEATEIRRQGNVVTITLDIPPDANLGVLLDCHLEFEGAARGGRNRVYKRNDVLRVVE